MEKTYTVTEASKILNRTVKCLQLWDRNGTLKSHRTETNRRFYTESQILKFKGLDLPSEDRMVYVYARVSSNNQKVDLNNQIKILKEYVLNKGYVNTVYFSEIGGGLNFNRPIFNQIIKDIQLGKVSKLVVAHKDRLCRFGFDLLVNISANNGCVIEIIDDEKLSPEKEMVQDLMTIIHCFSSRLYGLRNYKKSLKSALVK